MYHWLSFQFAWPGPNFQGRITVPGDHFSAENFSPGDPNFQDQNSGDSTSALHLRQCSFSRVEMSRSSLGHAYQQVSSQCWQWARSFAFVTTAKEPLQIQQCHGSQVFLLERIPRLKSWRTCPVMQGSMEIKLTMVFILPVLQRWSKPMYQRRVSKKALGTVL